MRTFQASKEKILLASWEKEEFLGRTEGAAVPQKKGGRRWKKHLRHLRFGSPTGGVRLKERGAISLEEKLFVRIASERGGE